MWKAAIISLSAHAVAHMFSLLTVCITRAFAQLSAIASCVKARTFGNESNEVVYLTFSNKDMEVITKQKIASVEITEVRISEDEIAVYEAALAHALRTLDAKELERRFGATHDEVEGMRDDLHQLIAPHDESSLKPVLT